MNELAPISEKKEGSNPAILDEFHDLLKLWKTKEKSGEEDAAATLELLNRLESRANELLHNWPRNIALAAAAMTSFVFGGMRVNYFDQSLMQEGINLLHWIAFGGLGAASGLTMMAITHPIAQRIAKMKSESLLRAGIILFSDDLPKENS